MVSVVFPVPPEDRATAPVEPPPGKVALTLTFTLLVAETFAVPAYPPVEVRVMVEFPVFPGDAEMVTLVAVMVMPGLVTVTVALPEEEA
jgi:hypothetical protein